MTAAAVPGPLLSWLAERHSLTRRLRLHCRGRFHVRIVDESWCRPNADEAEVLALPPGSVALVRQVFLFCDTTAMVYARSILPVGTLTGRLRRLKHLGTRPLGDLLFADPYAERRAIEIAGLDPAIALFHLAARHSAKPVTAIWGRRSVFHLNDKPLLVSEFFLPGLWDAGARQPCANAI
jgi:chorismate--pyruvate lyase